MQLAIRHVILDRDGVLNAEPTDGSYIVDPAQWRWLPGTLESLAALSAAGIRVSVATNQSCVGRGLITRDQLDAIHARMLDEATMAGGAITGLLVCTHSPTAGCGCRKPAPGLLLDALHATRIPRGATIALGDDLRDIQAARWAGIRAVLVRSGKGSRTEAQVPDASMLVFDDLREFTSALLSGSITRSTERTA